MSSRKPHDACPEFSLARDRAAEAELRWLLEQFEEAMEGDARRPAKPLQELKEPAAEDICRAHELVEDDWRRKVLKERLQLDLRVALCRLRHRLRRIEQTTETRKRQATPARRQLLRSNGQALFTRLGVFKK